MSDEKISSSDLEKAVSRGIFKGGMQLSMFIFLAWIFMPLILPIIMIVRDYAASRWLEPFVKYISQKTPDEIANIVKSILGIILACIILWNFSRATITTLVESNFSMRIFVWFGSISQWRQLGIIFGFCAALSLIIFSSAMISMSRPFAYGDLIFLVLNLLIMILLLVVSIRGSGKSSEHSAR